MFSIKFSRNDEKDCTQVNVNINTDLSVEQRVIVCTLERETQISAELLLRHLQKEYHSLIENAHRAAYEQGFKDGKQHKKKGTWFRRHFCDRNQNPCY